MGAIDLSESSRDGQRDEVMLEEVSNSATVKDSDVFPLKRNEK